MVERDGQVSVFNTLDHRISGVSQQQGGDTSLTFTSQYGTVSTLSLPLISGPGLAGNADPTNFAAPSPAPSSQAPSFPSQAPSSGTSGRAANQGGHDIVSLLEKLGQLRDSGVLTDDEFASKKAELLGRL